MTRATHVWWVVGLGVALTLALFSPLASSRPDGLERVAEDTGFIEQAEEAPYVVMPDYTIPGIRNDGMSTIISGVSGTLVVFALAWGLSRVLRSRTGSAGRADPESHAVTKER